MHCSISRVWMLALEEKRFRSMEINFFYESDASCWDYLETASISCLWKYFFLNISTFELSVAKLGKLNLSRYLGEEKKILNWKWQKEKKMEIGILGVYLLELMVHHHLLCELDHELVCWFMNGVVLLWWRLESNKSYNKKIFWVKWSFKMEFTLWAAQIGLDLIWAMTKFCLIKCLTHSTKISNCNVMGIRYNLVV